MQGLRPVLGSRLCRVGMLRESSSGNRVQMPQHAKF